MSTVSAVSVAANDKSIAREWMTTNAWTVNEIVLFFFARRSAISSHARALGPYVLNADGKIMVAQHGVGRPMAAAGRQRW